MINLAVIGAGVMGSYHARVLSELPDINLVAICDTDKKRARILANKYSTKFYENIDQLLKSHKIDAAIIAAPTSFHYKLSSTLLKKGIHLLIEKPLASNATEAKKIIKAAQKHNCLVAVGHIERFNPAVIKLKGMLSRKHFGDIVSIAIKRVGLFPPRIRDVNVVTDLAVHDLDIVCTLLDKEPISVYATGGKSLTDQIDFADIFLDFGSTTCYLQVNWITPIKIRSLSITGISGYAELDYIEQELTTYHNKRNSPIPKEFKQFLVNFGKAKKTTIKMIKYEPLKAEVESFIRSVKTKKIPQVSGNDGLRAVKLAEAVIESLTKRKIIKFK